MMASLVLERLSLIIREVEEGIEAVSSIIQRWKEEGIGTVSEDEEVLSCVLEKDTKRLEAEITRFVNLESTPELTEKLREYSTVQFRAEKVLTEYKVRTKEKTEKIVQQTGNTRLPTFELCKFNGDVLQWDEFWDQFCSSVHNRENVEEVDKLKYLHNALEGDAKKVIEGLKTTSSNYSIAVNRLKHRYGKPGKQIDAHYNALYLIPNASNVTTDCRRVLDTIERHLSVLHSMGEDRNQKSLRPVLMDKFPPEIRHDLRLLTTSDDHTLTELCSFLDKVITAREDAADCSSINLPAAGPSMGQNITTEALYSGPEAQEKAVKSKPNPPKAPDRFQKFQRGKKRSHPQSIWKEPHKSLTHASNNSNGTPAKSNKRGCIFCSGSHYSESCTVIETVNKRREWVSNHKLCFVCLSPKHMAFSCPDKRKCYHCKEVGRHHRSLCPKLDRKGKNETTTSSLITSSRISTSLQTALVSVTTPNGLKLPCRILFDTGSEKSYISSKAAYELRLKHAEKATLTIYTFGSKVPIKRDTALVSFFVPTEEKLVEVQAYVVPTTTGNIPAFKSEKQEIQTAYPQFTLAMDVGEDQPADIVIGNDFYYSFMSGDVTQLSNGLYLLKSRLGWIVSGSFKRQKLEADRQLSVLTYVHNSVADTTGFSLPDPPLRDDNVKDIWELETIGIRDSPKVLQEEEAITYFNETTVYEDGRYHVRWPWAQYPPDLSINYGLALGRLKSLIKRLDAPLLQAYNAVLKDQQEKGVVETIVEDHLPRSHPVHYLPHQCVVQEHKTTKVRIVYDASAKSKGQHSLNDLLYKGPLMLEDLLALLLRFRSHRIGIIADIEKAFLQVGLQNPDRDVTRFLWMKDINKPVSDDNLLTMRFCRVPFGVISSPFLLAAIINFHLRKKGTPAALQMSRGLYVDNLVTGTDSKGDAVTLYNEARENFGELSMNIREWSSNDKKFLAGIPKPQRNDDETVTVLGVRWNTVNDQLSLAAKPPIFEQQVSTKRQALRVIASVFDPCGITAPLTLPARLFLQSLWMKKVKWDDVLTTHQQEIWARCVQSLNVIPTVAIPRHYFHDVDQPTSVELHCFTDSSDDCYSAVTYIRVPSDDKVSVSLVMSRSRLTPIKNRECMTTPKLELLAVLIGTRLLSYVQRTVELPWSETFLWTDSQIVLSWLKSERLLPPFVARRVDEIKKATNVQFRHVPTQVNPADVATRPLKSATLPSLWLLGPEFLYKDASSWPSPVDDEILPKKTDCFLVADCRPHYPMLTNATTSTSETYELPEQGIVLSTDTVRRLQRSHYPSEANGCKTVFALSLGLIKDDQGILRCRGRYQNASLTYNQKNPILLPPDSDVTYEIVQRIHEGNCHVGVNHTLSLLRNQYWVPKGRSTVLKVLRRCKECIKYGGGPYKLPDMPSLPRERIEYSPPFTFTGLDYLGPLTVLVEGKPQKRWVCLYTCMAVRAIHLEVVSNLSADEFMMGLRRFAATRGVPTMIVSDNATQFKLSATLLSSVVIRGKPITWKFIPAMSPWQGGFYERLVGLVKHCLQRTIDRSLLSDSQLATVMKEIEAVLNTRPLTAVGCDPETVLTPAHFLSTCGDSLIEPPTETRHTSSTGENMVHWWKKTASLRHEFRKMFVAQYLLGLRDQHGFRHKQPRVVSSRAAQIGDLVQLKGDSKNRSLWVIGRISGLLTSSDGAVRTAYVTLNSGRVLCRSVGHLYPLELPSAQGEASALPSTADSSGSAPALPLPIDSSTVPSSPPSLPLVPPGPAAVHGLSNPPGSDGSAPVQAVPGPRRAALVARDRIRRWTASLLAAAIHRQLPDCV